MSNAVHATVVANRARVEPYGYGPSSPTWLLVLFALSPVFGIALGWWLTLP